MRSEIKGLDSGSLGETPIGVPTGLTASDAASVSQKTVAKKRIRDKLVVACLFSRGDNGVSEVHDCPEFRKERGSLAKLHSKTIHQELTMIRLSKILLLLVCVSVFSSSAFAQDNVIGKWKVVAETPQGQSNSVWEFSRDGDAVSGRSTNDDTGEVAEFKDVKVEGGTITFSIDIDLQGNALVLNLEAQTSGEGLEGNWTACDTNGNELAEGSLSGTKVAEKKKKSEADPFIGQWDSIAVLPGGEQSKGVFSVVQKDGKLSGSLDGDNGKTDFDDTSVSKGKLYVALKVNAQGSMRNIEIEAEEQEDGSLAGEWILIVGEEEAATGAWSATKRIETEVLLGGDNLDNFRGYREEAIGKGWTVKDGTLHFDGSKSGDIITKKAYGSFELTFDWKVSEGGNSGVMYRVTLGDGAPYMSGIEYQILDNDKHADGKKRATSAAALYALYQPGDKMPKAVGEWNSSKIVIDGDKVQHWLNGDKVVDVEKGRCQQVRQLEEVWQEQAGSYCFPGSWRSSLVSQYQDQVDGLRDRLASSLIRSVHPNI